MYLYAEVAVGFVIATQPVSEAVGTLVMEVSVLSGTLQRSVDITFKTVESTLKNAATSELARKRHVCLSARYFLIGFD